ncbi:hypothetical protein C5N14_12580 [Micromonospora sp. MW-13]|nr:hypothetical protein C5N14_12580 [Micromonospora sp. MW-13]
MNVTPMPMDATPASSVCAFSVLLRMRTAAVVRTAAARVAGADQEGGAQEGGAQEDAKAATTAPARLNASRTRTV